MTEQQQWNFSETYLCGDVKLLNHVTGQKYDSVRDITKLSTYATWNESVETFFTFFCWSYIIFVKQHLSNMSSNKPKIGLKGYPLHLYETLMRTSSHIMSLDVEKNVETSQETSHILYQWNKWDEMRCFCLLGLHFQLIACTDLESVWRTTDRHEADL